MSILNRDPLQIIVFQSYGTDTHFYLRGRAMEDESIDLEDRSRLSLLINTWKRLDTDIVRHTGLDVKLPDGTILKTKTDARGYFKVEAKLKGLMHLANAEGWLKCEVSYSDAAIKQTIKNENIFSAEVLIPSSTLEYGVVSDIDDTILHTGVVSVLKWRLLYNTLFKSAKMRLPLEGAAHFYNLLHRGKSGKNANPIFYVSHSPWNLYRYLDLFLKQNKFPKGPILLRNINTILKLKPKGQKPEKQKEILNILKMYPDIRFVLIGDSGEHDPDIYIEIAEQFPDRILAIYLRSVKHNRKMLRVQKLLSGYKTTPALLVESSAQAIAHARAHGFII